MLSSVRDLLSEKLATYVRLVMALLCQAELGLSPRRGGMLLRNILAVHTARLLVEPDANLCESALLALTHSFPQRALGVEVSRIKVLKCHREAWQAAARMTPDDPETTFASNLLVGLFASGELSVEADVEQTLEAWQQTRSQVKELAA